MENTLFVKAKCDLHRSSLTFHHPAGTVLTDPAKVSAVAAPNLLQVSNKFANFCHCFIRDYRKVVAPFTRPTSTLRVFHLTHEDEAAFSQLKALFSSTPIQSHPDPSQQFVVEVDASNVGVSVS